MILNLTRPLAIFDLETTGINISTDRIVEIAILKVLPDGATEFFVHKVNPTIPIPPSSSRVHGIYDKDVEHEPSFRILAPTILEFLHDCDLAGYNSNRFDIPILVEEFLRIGIDFHLEDRKMVDVLGIFQKMEQRNLAAAYKFYCSKDLENAHQAEVDVRATFEVMLAQLARYPQLRNDVEFLHQFTNNPNTVDLAGKFILNEQGAEVFTFGKFKGRMVSEVLKNEPSYFDWFMKQDFPLQTKNVLGRLRQKYMAV